MDYRKGYLMRRWSKTYSLFVSFWASPKLKASGVLFSETNNAKSVQPYGSSYFFPGKIVSKAAIPFC